MARRAAIFVCAMLAPALACSSFGAADSGASSSGSSGSSGSAGDAGDGGSSSTASAECRAAELFETFEGGAWRDAWNIVGTALEEDTTLGSTALRVGLSATASSHSFLRRQLPPCHFVVSARIHAGALGDGEVDFFGIVDDPRPQEGDGLLLVTPSASPGAIHVESFQDGNPNEQAPAGIQAGKWVAVSMDVDPSTRAFSVSVDGLVVSKGTLARGWPAGGQLYLKVGVSWWSKTTTDYRLYFDDVRVTAR